MSNQKEINGRVYSFGYIPPTRAVKVQAELAKLIGGALFQLAGKKGSAPDVGAAAISTMLANVDSDSLLATIQTAMEFTTITEDGKPRRVNLDADFNGRPKDMWLVFVAALQYNFADFLPASLFDSVRAKLQV